MDQLMYKHRGINQKGKDLAGNPLVRERPLLEPWQTVDTRSVPKELEEMISRAGMALMLEFFPA